MVERAKVLVEDLRSINAHRGCVLGPRSSLRLGHKPLDAWRTKLFRAYCLSSLREVELLEPVGLRDMVCRAEERLISAADVEEVLGDLETRLCHG